MTDVATENKSHGLICPACKVDLLMSDRQGIEIDFCPKCRGVWLDRGELDKIIERSTVQEQPRAPAPALQAPPTYPAQGDNYDSDRHGYPKRRRSFLQELFD